MPMMVCRICGRSQVYGLLSSQSWGKLADQPCVCPECKSKHSDWQTRAESSSAA
jgi:hypothetical protein